MPGRKDSESSKAKPKDSEPRLAEVGRYQIVALNNSRDFVLLDTVTGDSWLRLVAAGTWGYLKNPG